MTDGFLIQYSDQRRSATFSREGARTKQYFYGLSMRVRDGSLSPLLRAACGEATCRQGALAGFGYGVCSDRLGLLLHHLHGHHGHPAANSHSLADKQVRVRLREGDSCSVHPKNPTAASRPHTRAAAGHTPRRPGR